jgi:hypothetical protein
LKSIRKQKREPSYPLPAVCQGLADAQYLASPHSLRGLGYHLISQTGTLAALASGRMNVKPKFWDIWPDVPLITQHFSQSLSLNLQLCSTPNYRLILGLGWYFL